MTPDALEQLIQTKIQVVDFGLQLAHDGFRNANVIRKMCDAKFNKCTVLILKDVLVLQASTADTIELWTSIRIIIIVVVIGDKLPGATVPN